MLDPARGACTSPVPSGPGRGGTDADRMLRDPAKSGMLRDPAKSGMLRDPAKSGMLRDPAKSGMLRDPAKSGMLRDRATCRHTCPIAVTQFVTESQLSTVLPHE